MRLSASVKLKSRGVSQPWRWTSSWCMSTSVVEPPPKESAPIRAKLQKSAPRLGAVTGPGERSTLQGLERVGEALAQARFGDADELRALDQLRQRVCPEVAHAGAEAAHELEQDFADGAAVGHDRLHPFGHAHLEALLVDAQAQAA